MKDKKIREDKFNSHYRSISLVFECDDDAIMDQINISNKSFLNGIKRYTLYI